MKKVIIDTNIFEFAFVKPKDSEFLELHQKANTFLKELLKTNDILILMSSYQVAEVLEVFRKVNATVEAKESFLELIREPRVFIRETSYELMIKAYHQSNNSHIHIWDYLVVLPFQGEIDEIYSADEHFQHQDFTALATVNNPISGWVLIEGRRPQKLK